MRRIISAFAIGLIASTAMAQENFPGTNLPITMLPSELTAEYWPVKLKEQSSGIFGDWSMSITLSKFSWPFDAVVLLPNRARSIDLVHEAREERVLHQCGFSATADASDAHNSPKGNATSISLRLFPLAPRTISQSADM